MPFTLKLTDDTVIESDQMSAQSLVGTANKTHFPTLVDTAGVVWHLNRDQIVWVREQKDE